MFNSFKAFFSSKVFFIKVLIVFCLCVFLSFLMFSLILLLIFNIFTRSVFVLFVYKSSFLSFRSSRVLIEIHFLLLLFIRFVSVFKHFIVVLYFSCTVVFSNVFVFIIDFKLFTSDKLYPVHVIALLGYTKLLFIFYILSCYYRSNHSVVRVEI